MKKIIVIAACLIVGAAIVFSQIKTTPRIDKREKKQEKRIKQGEKKVVPTPREAKRSEKREAKIQQDEMKAKSDGAVTPAEKKKLHREMNSTGRFIARKKHNPHSAK
jgi:hypothetical protein